MSIFEKIKITSKRAFILGIIADAIFMLAVLLSFIMVNDGYGHFYMPAILFYLLPPMFYLSGTLFCIGLIALFLHYKSYLLRTAVIFNIFSSLYTGFIFLLFEWFSSYEHNFFNTYHDIGPVRYAFRFAIPIILAFVLLTISFSLLFKNKVVIIFSVLIMIYSIGLVVYSILGLYSGYELLYEVKILISPAKLLLYIGALISLKKNHKLT